MYFGLKAQIMILIIVGLIFILKAVRRMASVAGQKNNYDDYGNDDDDLHPADFYSGGSGPNGSCGETIKREATESFHFFKLSQRIPRCPFYVCLQRYFFYY